MPKKEQTVWAAALAKAEGRAEAEERTRRLSEEKGPCRNRGESEGRTTVSHTTRRKSKGIRRGNRYRTGKAKYYAEALTEAKNKLAEREQSTEEIRNRLNSETQARRQLEEQIENYRLQIAQIETQAKTQTSELTGIEKQLRTQLTSQTKIYEERITQLEETLVAETDEKRKAAKTIYCRSRSKDHCRTAACTTKPRHTSE